MKIGFPAIVAALALGLSGMASAAGGKVSYQCLNNKKVSVSYSFNSAGIPTRAVANIKGKQRTLKYDMASSDDVDTLFKDSSGYSLSTSYMDSGNYRDASIVILSPGSEVLFKDCSPSAAGPDEDAPGIRDASRITKRGSVSYMCENSRRLKVDYGFNGAGVPVKAEAVLKGKKRSLQYDLARSDDVDTFFKDKGGYNLSASSMDSGNFRESSIMVTAPGGEILYKDCSPNGR